MNKFILLVSLVFLSLTLISCSGKQEGPAEKAGKEIDKSIDSGKKAVDSVIEKATERIEELSDASDGPAEQAGKKIDKALEDAADKVEEISEELKEK
ncbi:hypothetical protein [Nitrosomonas sp.]|uniref:hypothetical protein n=1 Tax=Nitrosomonas sp. TaxID=42353 RepID=UPI001D705FAD|nr:hypothetical protein [Nitrosomonas sp.]MBX3616270.1 hypothetical protein [Nitrosomonas sp.]